MRLVDYLGGDARIVQTARVSYGDGTKSAREDAALIDYLMRHQHTSPFEHVVLEFHCKMPIFVARQWVRHRSARLNEMSARYSIMRDEFYLPAPEQVQRQARDNKQGRADNEVPPELQQRVIDLLRRDQEAGYATYREMLKDDVARELARINLPVSLYTEWFWQMDLHNLFRFLALRLDPHAQWEIREYAQVIARIVKVVTPMAFASFERHQLRGRRFSGEEMAALRTMLQGGANPLSGRRLAEFDAKLAPSGEPRISPRGRGRRRGTRAAARAGAGARPARGGAAPPAAPAAEPQATPSGFPSIISREAVNHLPLRHFEGTIHLVQDDGQLGAMLKQVAKEKVLGFDTESRPSFQRGENYPVAIVQLSTDDEAWVIQLRGIGDLSPLVKKFSDAGVLKVGVALDQDLAKLRELCAFTPAGFFDLGPATSKLGIQNNGLRALAAIVLGFRISKSMQRTNWAREVLSQRQLVYAATDAWAGLKIYNALHERRLV